jgi:hypothetical protein
MSKVTIDREKLRLVLGALKCCYDVDVYPADGSTSQDEAIILIEEALAQPAQEQPVHMEIPEPEGWYCYDHDYPYEGHKYHTVEQIQKIVTAAVEAERKALAQPAQEPVAYIRKDQLQKAMQSAMLCEVTSEPRQDRVRIYTTPPKREWVGLTDDEREGIAIDYSLIAYKLPFKEIEAKLKEKNTCT